MNRHTSGGWLSCLLIACLLSASSCHVLAQDFESLRLNQLQLVGTHNSYHQRPDSPRGQSKATLAEWDYSHAPLNVQLDRGVRSLALDLHYTGDDFEVFHLPKVDEGTSCTNLAEALQQVRNWSDNHPRHIPVVVFFEMKEEGTRFDSRLKVVDAPGFEKLDRLITTIFAPTEMITPSNVQGESPTLREAIETRGWPTLGESRGRVLFVLNEKGKIRNLYQQGTDTSPARPMFVRSDPSRSDAAFTVVGNPKIEAIRELLDSGYLVRARADSGLKEGRVGDTTRRENALQGGANIVTTDFPPGEADPKTGYVVQIPTVTAARVNPISGPATLQGKAVPE